jgi:lipopolysaccharide transport system ATP-binding protein
MSMQKQPVIRLQNVSKRFAFRPDSPQSVLETVISAFSRRRSKTQDLWAVHDVSFDVMSGQAIGIVGRNGSGKSTLLKLIARILQPTQGEIMVRGRVSALLELGAGFHPDLTGRENIFLNASVLGLTKEETEEMYADIVEFSELGDFINMPVKHYSSGMYMRLGFSVAIHVRPDILIVDEILAVGDQTFQAKCVDRILDMKRAGVTILFISHNTTILSVLCTDLVWLDHGRVKMVGPTEQVLDHYRDHIFRRVGDQLAYQNKLGSFRRWGTGEIEISAVTFFDVNGQPATLFRTGDPMIVEIQYDAHKPVLEPEFGLAIFRQDGLHINGPNTRTGGLRMGTVEGLGIVRYTIDSLPLLPASYHMTVAVHDSLRPVAYDFHEEAYSFRVVEGGTAETEGAIALNATWDWQAALVDPQDISTFVGEFA